MPSANSTLRVTGLDFATIRRNIVSFLQGKAEFAEFDFDSTALAVLIDTFAYTTYYNAFLVNVGVNEAYIDSARLRENVVSRAKALGYTPVSARGAAAQVRLTWTEANSSSILSIAVNSDTEFAATVNGIEMTFVTPRSYTVTANSDGGFHANVELIEGVPLTHRYAFNPSTNATFTLPNANVDSRSIRVQTIDGSNTYTWTEFDDLFALQANSTVYFVEAERDDKLKVSFGDGVLGKVPATGSTVAISHRVCSGIDGNGARTFSPKGTVGGRTDCEVTSLSSATGGTQVQSTESIRSFAPRAWETQGRAGTSHDYERIILRDNPDFEAVRVWGGQENDPPIYGKVFICVKPQSPTRVIGLARKQDVATSIQRRNMMTIQPEFVDATYVFIVPEIEIRYDPTIYVGDASDLLASIGVAVREFENDALGLFERKFKRSRFLRKLDDVDRTVRGSDAVIKLQKRFTPSLTTRADYTMNFNAQLDGRFGALGETCLISSAFTLLGHTSYFDDDGSGNLRIYYLGNGGVKTYLSLSAGTIDYVSGLVVVKSFLPTAIDGEELAITVLPRSPNFSPVRNQILLISGAHVMVYNDNTDTLEAEGDIIGTEGDSLQLLEFSFSTTVTF